MNQERFNKRINPLKEELKKYPHNLTLISKIANIYFFNNYYEEASIFYELYCHQEEEYTNDIYLRLLICYLYMNDSLNAYKIFNILANNISKVSLNSNYLSTFKDLILRLMNNRFNSLAIELNEFIKETIPPEELYTFYQKCMFASDRIKNYELALYFSNIIEIDHPTFHKYYLYYSSVLNIDDNSIPNLNMILNDIFIKKEDAFTTLKKYKLTPIEYMEALVVIIKHKRAQDDFLTSMNLLNAYANLITNLKDLPNTLIKKAKI